MHPIKPLAGTKKTADNALRSSFIGDRITSISFRVLMGTFEITYGDVLTLLSIIAVVLLIVVLFNLIFVSASLKRVADRLDSLSEEVESLIMKPIGTIDYVIDWFIALIENMQKGGGEKKRKK